MDNLVITVWKDGTWKKWSAFDANLTASMDENWLVNIPNDRRLHSLPATHLRGESDPPVRLD